jgi:hypothetical protein
MVEPTPSFLNRLALAWRTLVDTSFAADVARLQTGRLPAPDAQAPSETAPEPVRLKEAIPDSALQMLGLLQQEGRFVDFLQEDVSGFSDAEIGGAARVVHEGCRKALRQHLVIEPIRNEPEASRITLAEGFDAAAIRLTGNVQGKPPFTGTLAHRGWRATQITLPKIAPGHDVSVVAQAEVEL